MTYVVVQTPPESRVGRAYFGGAREFWRYQGHECILEGPYETGKTIAALDKLHNLLCKYGGARALMTRKTYKSLVQSAVVTFEQKVLPVPPDHPDSGVRSFGKSKPEFYDYPNGSRLVVAGLDNADKVLSSEYDYIYFNQAEEGTLDDWEKLLGRATGRAENVPYPQVFGDCNPDVPTHWIKNRKTLKLFRQLHLHNPTLYDQATGELTERGMKTMAILNSLTGLRYKRGVLGLWVGAEGLVYEGFDPAVHVIPRFDIPPLWTRYCAVDFGYTNPFAYGWFAVDPDGRVYLYREIYMTRRTVKVHSEQIKRLTGDERIFQTIADHDAEDRATLHENGIITVAARKDITTGIQLVEERLKVQPDGKPRFFILEDSLVEADTALYREYPGDTQPVNTEQEFSSYAWPDGRDGKPNKEVPIDMYNHGLDRVRYLFKHLDGGGGTTVSTGKAVGLYRGRR